MQIKRIMQSIFFIGILSGFAYYLIVNKNGLLTYWHMKQEVLLEKQEVNNLEQEIAELEQKCDSWNSSSLEKERLAREDLLMSYTNEYVYLLPTDK